MRSLTELSRARWTILGALREATAKGDDALVEAYRKKMAEYDVAIQYKVEQHNFMNDINNPLLQVKAALAELHRVHNRFPKEIHISRSFRDKLLRSVPRTAYTTELIAPEEICGFPVVVVQDSELHGESFYLVPRDEDQAYFPSYGETRPKQRVKPVYTSPERVEKTPKAMHVRTGANYLTAGIRLWAERIVRKLSQSHTKTDQ